MEDDRFLHCKMCNLAYLNFDEMQKHVKEVHWKIFHGDKIEEKKITVPKIIKVDDVPKDVPKPFESLLTEKTKERVVISPEKQEIIKQHGLLGKLLFGVSSSKHGETEEDLQKQVTKPIVSVEEKQPTTTDFGRPSTSTKEESNVVYELDEKWADLEDDAKVIKILEMQNVITTDILDLYEKEEGHGLRGKLRTPPGGQLSEARGDLFPAEPPDQADEEETSGTTPTTSTTNVQPSQLSSQTKERSSENVQTHDSEANEWDEFWREYDEGIDRSGVPLFGPLVRSSSPPRINVQTKQILEGKFGEARNIRTDSYFDYLWNQSLKRKDKETWHSNKITDVIDAHGWGQSK